MYRIVLGSLITLAGIAFTVFPILRPWGDKTGSATDMTAAFADPMWIAAHTIGMLAWMLLGLALALGALHARRPADNEGELKLPASAMLAITGAMLLLPFYGAETFGLGSISAIANQVGGDAGIDAAQNVIRNGAVQLTMFTAGFLLLSIATMTIAITQRSWQLGVVAFGVVSYLPQFMLAPELRIGHGIILGAGCLLWAMQVIQDRRRHSQQQA